VTSWLTIESTRHQVAIAGQVRDARTGQPIPRARVQISAGPAEFQQRLALHAQQHGDRWEQMAERLDRAWTRSDGRFHFLDLPDGDYSLGFSLPLAGSRYGQAQTTAAVARNPAGDVTMAAVDVTLAPTGVEGRVTAANSGDPIVLGRLRLAGSGEIAFSNGDGRYELLAVEVGNRRLSAQALGYAVLSQPVSLTTAGQIKALDFVLVPE